MDGYSDFFIPLDFNFTKMNNLVRWFLNSFPRQTLIRLSYYFLPLLSLVFRGRKYHCPVCEGNFRQFLPYGYNTIRAHVLCPGCLSLERHRLIWLFLKEKTDFFVSPLKILHIAPEQCFLKRFRKLKNLDYTTGDLLSPIADVKMDVRQIPFANNTFDVVMCNHVLEHIVELDQAVGELLRVLKPGGWAILQVPLDVNLATTIEDPSVTSPAERNLLYGQYDHVRLFGTDFPEILRRYGFETREEDFCHLLPDGLIRQSGLTRNEILFRYFKPDKI